MFYKFALVVCRFFLFFALRIKAVGRENVPAEGGCLLVLNHRSNLDVVIAGMTCPRPLRFMAKSELFKNKLFGRLITALGAFPVHRGKGDIGAIKSALAKLHDNEMVLMFPEGRRVADNEEKSVRAKPGAVMLAIRAQVPILPVYISGKFSFMKKITITYGKPITYEQYYGEKQSVEELQVLSDEMMKTVRSLRV